VSSMGAVRLLREAKSRGLAVTAEVTPHHLTLTHDALLGYNTACKVNPPLRELEDREALRQALKDDTIDCIATDHAPHSPVEKDVEFECAAPGMLGLETALPLILDFVRMGTLDDKRAIAALTGAATRAFGLPGGTLAIGSVADICVIDPERPFTISPEGLSSKSKNSPFIGQKLAGRAVLTLVEGRTVYDLDNRFERTEK